MVVDRHSATWLRMAYLAGAITDAAALIPMLFPPAATIMWGFTSFDAGFHFAMGYAAALMFGWTLLLLWAFWSPLERRFIAALTVVVIAGLAATEVVTAAAGLVSVGKLIPTLILQTILFGLFCFSYANSRRKPPPEVIQ